MELGNSGEATNWLGTRHIPSILYNRDVHYRIHKSSSLVPILSQSNPVHTTMSYLYNIHLNVIHNSNYTGRILQITQLLSIQFSSPSRQFIPLWPKYSPQCLLLKHPYPMLPPQQPYRTTGKIIVLNVSTGPN
jgi:hypothetical protein